MSFCSVLFIICYVTLITCCPSPLCLCVPLCVSHMYVWMQTCSPYTHVCIRIYVWMHTCSPYTHMCIRMYVWMQTCSPYTHMCIRMYVWMHTCSPYTHVCIRMYVWMHTCSPYTHVCMHFRNIKILRDIPSLDKSMRVLLPMGRGYLELCPIL